MKPSERQATEQRGCQSPGEWASAIRSGTLTIESLCGFLELEIPPELEGIKRQQLSRIATSSRTVIPNSVYFAATSREDSPKFIARGFRHGALCIFAAKTFPDKAGTPYPCVICPRPLEAAARVAALIREGTEATVIAITGSIGKTTVKEMLRLVCAERFRTEYSKKNQNGFGQVVRRLQQMDSRTEVFIQEAGLSKPGSLMRSAVALQPNAFVITNIGLNHVGYFGGDQRGILREKLSLDVYAAPGATGFVNWDDPLLREAPYQHDIVRYAIDAPDADYRAQNIVEQDGRVSFEVVERTTGKRVPIVLNLAGRHNVGNAVCAYAVGRWLGVPQKKIVRALAGFSATGVRQHLVWLAGQHVYLDCYNASEGAAQSTVSAMAKIDVPKGGKRVLVFADIDDKLGERTEEVHRRLGRTLAAHPEGVDLLLCFGEHAAWTAEEAAAAGLDARSTTNRRQLERWIRELVGPDDLLGFKGGQQMMLSKTVDNLYGTPFFTLDRDVVVNVTKGVTKRRGMEYRVLADYGVEVRGRIKRSSAKSWKRAIKRAIKAKPDRGIRLLSKVDGARVRVIDRNAFAESTFARVTLPSGVRAIDSMAFHRALRLREVELPSTLRYIGPRAFGTCLSLKRLTVPEGVTTIGELAFSTCPSLVEVRLPASVKSIGPDIFARSPRVRVVCPEGSVAYEYCMEHYPRRCVKA